MASQAEHLAFAARKAAAREGYIAYFLEKYREYERLDEEALREQLGCTTTAYYRLALSRAPQQEQPDFRDHVQRIASVANVSPFELARILRHVWALQSLREAEYASGERHMLLAARDREQEKEAEPSRQDDDEDIKPGDG